jgi:hypothetical protein
LEPEREDGVHHFVEVLIVDEEIGDVGELRYLGVFKGDGDKGAEHDIVGEGHVCCDLDCFF